MDFLVVVLDGMSYVFANTFCWRGPNIYRLWGYPNTKRNMLFIDVLPETPHVATTFFQVRRFYESKVIKWIWELIQGKRVVAVNIPTEIPPIYYNIQRPKEWLNYMFYPKAFFREAVFNFHDFVKRNLKADIGFVWYMIPDQAHHHFFPVINDLVKLKEAIQWYDLACRLALDLIETLKPKKWLVLSDHGFASGVQDTPLKALYHNRDGVVITNCGEPPKRASDVVYWLAEKIGILK